MSSVDQHLHDVDIAICDNISNLADNRGLLSQNMLSQLRNLAEGVAVRAHTNDGGAEYDYDAITAGLAYIKARGGLAFLNKFHGLLQPSASHYTFDGDGSERLMLKYYEYLYRIRKYLNETFGIRVLANLEDFPLDLDPSLRDYHQKIAQRIEAIRALPDERNGSSRYYIHKTRPFFVDGKIYYEVTFSNPTDKVSKFDRIIAFTDIDITDNYAANLTLRSDSITVLGQTMPITVIRAWVVSIRPCEVQNFARLVGSTIRISTGSNEYRRLMNFLTDTGSSLIDLVDLSDDRYEAIKATILEGRRTPPRIFPALDRARSLMQNQQPGYIVIRYLLMRLKNVIVRQQFSSDACPRLSDLNLQWGCIPFDQMPFCTSLPRHNPRFWDLMSSLDTSNRTHELLARRIKNNVDQRGMLYTPIEELENFGDVTALINQHNGALYRTHQARSLDVDRRHVYIRGYEDETVKIIEKLQEYATSGVGGWTDAVDHWLEEHPSLIDDTAKSAALRSLFVQSRVALIYGAAGTGKSWMVNHIANYFNDGEKLFLAHTNPAVDNLKRKVQAQNATFKTVTSHLLHGADDPNYEVVVIDECSTVSNEDLIKVIENTRFQLLVLVGDVYQIESIQFGNWFGLARSFVPPSAVFELTTPYRTTNDDLRVLWQKVRSLEPDITETMIRGSYSTVLSESLFEPQRSDEIILCLNYDGLYGINNINRFLQSSNPNPPVPWGPSTYKVGDPVLFNETERFRPLIYNNLKGTITDIQTQSGRVRFEINLDRDITELSVMGTELEWVRDSVVALDVYQLLSSDEDDESSNTYVPFQVAYAVSIHKAQGLEYESVKVVITDSNEDDISHSILYTALTRARENLLVYWTPETQQAVISKLEHKVNIKDAQLLSARRNLTPTVPLSRRTRS